MLFGWRSVAVCALTAFIISGCDANTGLRSEVGNVKPEQYDHQKIDADGDGDRDILAGYNDINNPPINPVTPSTAVGDITRGDRSPGLLTADRLSDLAQATRGVDAAFAVISGRTAVIGVDLKRGLDPVYAKPIIEEIRKRVLIQAPGFLNVHITINRKITSRIDHIREGLRAGQPLSLFEGDIKELIRTVPAIPPYYSGTEHASRGK